MPLKTIVQAATKAAGICLLCSLAAQAAYVKWEPVELPAACGNGSPYRFFVNRTPLTTKTIVVFEGGGACWDQAAARAASSSTPSTRTASPPTT